MNQFAAKTSIIFDNAFYDLDLIRQHNPIVLNLTNLVVMQTTANILLSLGASPMMAHAKQELADMTALANSLVINIGTLDETWVHAIDYGQREALKQAIPIIFDPVGAGASQYRTKVAKTILNNGIHILRANPSEILALVNNNIKTKGVDTAHQSNEAIDAAKSLSEQYQCIIIISGKTDIIIDKNNIAFIPYGTPLFTKVTGMGCSATAVIGAFAAINNNYFLAAIHAMTIFTLAGQLAAKQCQGPASFFNVLVDSLFSLKKGEVKQFELDG
jgi:hydroxyethylthiazole kinase